METSSLIIKLNELPDRPSQPNKDAAPLLDAAFRIPGNNQLQLEVDDWCDRVVEYLEHVVSRTPRDLRSHVQRVYLSIERTDSEAAYGALVDLFIVLKDAGRPLRERMLKASRAVLDEAEYWFLEQHLEPGIRPTDAILPCKTSLLSKGLRGTHQLVTKLDNRETSSQDPLQEAHDHLEYGQIEEARQVLEAAVIKDPLRQILHHDLLEIYRRTDAKEAFLAMRQQLNAETNPAAAAWQDLAELFAEVS